MALTKEQHQVIEGRGRIAPTSWCCSGPFPVEGCKDAESHWHADCTACHWSESPRFWGPTPEDVAAQLVEHLESQHPAGPVQDTLF